jgi:hypothetical protein
MVFVGSDLRIATERLVNRESEFPSTVQEYPIDSKICHS